MGFPKYKLFTPVSKKDGGTLSDSQVTKSWKQNGIQTNVGGERESAGVSKVL